MIGVCRPAAAIAPRTVKSFVLFLLVVVGCRLGGGPADAQTMPELNGGPDKVQQLQDAIDAMRQGAVDHESLAYRTNYSFALLQLKKARLAQGKTWYFGDTSSERCVQAGLEALARIKRNTPLTATPGVLSELAYITDNDGTVQPYYLHLPSTYDPAKKWPLIVFLHGYVGSISVLDPWVLNEEVCQVAEDNGCALLIPYGRRNTDFQGVGEVDVLASTAQVQSLYSIDPDRVYMSGVSMGGMGAWNIALRHPGMYAATSPMSGQTDMHVWWPRVLLNWPASRDDIPPFRRMLVEWDNPIDLVMNARNQPMFVQHGELDSLIPVEQSRSMVAAAAKLGIPIKYGEFTGASHYIYFELPCFQNAWSWTKDFTLNRSPKRVTYKTYSLHYDTAFWATIADFVEWGKPATVDCQVTANGAGLTVKTENVRLLKVDVQQAPLQKVEDFTVTVNGRRTTARATANWDLYIVCDPKEPVEQAWPPHKRKGLCGPVEDVFNTRFLLVQGTSGSAADTDANRLNLARWAAEWDQFADGEPPLKPDKDVTEQDIATSNLVLFGTPATNSIIARIADKLPIQIGDQKYTVAGKTYQGDDLGLVMCYPNPLAPDHYVLIYSGVLYGQKCGINHKHDLLPDFIVFNNRNFNYDDTNEHEVAGYFGMDWELNPTSTYVREP
jgi:poly(3-hydroxybutyrate) depolymerase